MSLKIPDGLIYFICRVPKRNFTAYLMGRSNHFLTWQNKSGTTQTCSHTPVYACDKDVTLGAKREAPSLGVGTYKYRKDTQIK